MFYTLHRSRLGYCYAVRGRRAKPSRAIAIAPTFSELLAILARNWVDSQRRTVLHSS